MLIFDGSIEEVVSDVRVVLIAVGNNATQVGAAVCCVGASSICRAVTCYVTTEAMQRDIDTRVIG